MRNTEMKVRRLAETGNGRIEKVSHDLMAWVADYPDGMCDVYIGSKSRGRIVYEGEMPCEDAKTWIQNRKWQHEARLAFTIKAGTVYVKEDGVCLRVRLISDSDEFMDECLIQVADLYTWMKDRQDW